MQSDLPERTRSALANRAWSPGDRSGCNGGRCLGRDRTSDAPVDPLRCHHDRLGLPWWPWRVAQLPWCDDCSKFWNAPELGGNGECPSCGRTLAARSARPGRKAPSTSASAPASSAVTATAAGSRAVQASPAAPGEPTGATSALATTTEADAPIGTRVARAKGAPWHFKLMVIGVTVYMIYRIYWLIEWLPKHV